MKRIIEARYLEQFGIFKVAIEDSKGNIVDASGTTLSIALENLAAAVEPKQDFAFTLTGLNSCATRIVVSNIGELRS